MRKKVETEEEKRRRLLSPFRAGPLETSSDVIAPALTRAPALIESPVIEPMGSVITRETKPTGYIPPEPYVVYNNKARPVGVEGGLSQLSRNQALLEAQQNYKPKGSTKNLLLQLGLGFLRGGLPGVAASGLGYALDPGAVDRAQMERAMGQTEGALETDLNRRRIDSQMQEQQARMAALTRQPEAEAEQRREKDYQATIDNLRQLRGTTDPKEFEQLRRQEEIRLGRVIPLPTYQKQDRPPVEDEFTLPPGGVRYKRNADGTLTVLAERPERPSPSNVDEVGQRQAQLSAAQTRLQQAQTAAQAYQQQLQALDQSAAQITTNAPMMVPDENKIPQTARNPDGSIIYGSDKTPERIRYEQQRQELQQKLDQALKEVNDANVTLNSIYVPQPRGGQSLQRQSQGGGQRWSASKWAKANPNGDVAAAKAAAMAAGYQVVE